ncbi:hypothetical protein GCM10011515_19730 [Tsuneonella deserti]|uniref:Ankyrin repeats (3 copies) n=1 Tax=Tsuneonella deserti TaxID=2035528 RepID=A0ABQ1SBW2_9SPHN|nr:hypothetical protein GCM10011515_19730 [Tsuneonella deserti]
MSLALLFAGTIGGAGPVAAQDVVEMQLSAAARECRPSEVSALLAKGADVNSVNSGGYTPLMLAAGEGCIEAVKLLIAAGADTGAAHPTFGTATAQAKMNRQAKVLALLEGGVRSGPTPATPPSAPPTEKTNSGATAREANFAAGSSRWPAIGHYQVGQNVIYSGSGGKTWDRGVIKDIDPKYGYSIVDGPSGSYSNYFVVAPEREPFWTSYFVGDWRISVPVATGLLTDGRNVYRTVSGGMRLPPLRISADGTYSWRVQTSSGARTIRGQWKPNPVAPGVILENGENDADWLVYNNTDALSTLGETIILSSDCCTHYDGSRLK